MTLTTREVAHRLGITVGNVWVLVHREVLKPVNPGRKPSLFDQDEVDKVNAARKKGEIQAILAMAEAAGGDHD